MSRLSLTLCSSIATPKTNNKKGEDYEPESLKVMMASLDRHLRTKGCTLSIVRGREFIFARSLRVLTPCQSDFKAIWQFFHEYY